ncbi:protein ALP1-like, partial [Huso huso]
ETCEALYNVLKEKYLSVPRTETAWQGIAKQFEELWQFPRCIGALDGKHITIQPLKNIGSHYYNYKSTSSIVLMALVDADLKFLYVDIGTNGRVSDGGVWNKCTLSQALQDNSLHLPQPSALPLGTDPVPYVVVADEAFGLKKWIMKPYPQIQLTPENQIFNHRLSRAGCCVENAFGILANRWRVFRSTTALAPEKASHLVLAVCALHNYLGTQKTSRQIYTPSDSSDFEDVQTGQITQGQWRT